VFETWQFSLGEAIVSGFGRFWAISASARVILGVRFALRWGLWLLRAYITRSTVCPYKSSSSLVQISTKKNKHKDYSFS
jgi:hypothetical protein